MTKKSSKSHNTNHYDEYHQVEIEFAEDIDIAKLQADISMWKRVAGRAYTLAVGHGWDPETFSTMDEALDAYEAQQ